MPLIRAAEKLIYYAHVPKCGGTSVAEYLQDRFGPLGFTDRRHLSLPHGRRWTRSSPQHVAAQDLERLLPPGFVDASFALIRHPVDRLASVFLFQRETERRIAPQTGFGDWLAALPEARARDPFIYDNHVRPMAEIVPQACEIFRIEEGMAPLTLWLDRITDTVFAPDVGESQSRAARLQRNPALDRPFGVSAAERALIAELYAEDFRRFGYDPEAPTRYAAALPRRALDRAVPPPARQPPRASRFGGRALQIRGGIRQVGVAEGMAVEWKSDAVLPGPEGVAVRGLRIEGVDSLEIATPRDTGWIRLFCRLEKPTAAVLLGLRLVLRLVSEQGEAALRLRPMLIMSAPGRGRRQAVAETAVDLRLETGGWQEISGVFACLPQEKLAIDLLVDLPEGCRIQIAALDPLWREAPPLPGLLADLEAPGARPLSGFAACPLDEAVARHLQRPVLHGAVLRREGRMLSGWVMAKPAPLAVELLAGSARQDLALDVPLELSPGLVLPGFRVDLAPHLAAPEIELRCRFAAQPNRRIARMPSPLPQGQMIGPEGMPVFAAHVDWLGLDGIDGWILRRNGDPAPVELCLLIDGAPAAQLRSGLRRQDVAEFGLDSAFCGFSSPLPKSFFDGRSHRLELVEAETGLRLPNGLAELAMPLEGVAFLDRRLMAIAGWAAGGHGVSIVIDDAPTREILPDLPVLGLGPANRTGFALPLPPELIDGHWHSVKVFFTKSEIPLDGAPFSVRLHPEAPKVEILSEQENWIQARITGRDGPLKGLALRIDCDNAAVQHVRSAGEGDEMRAGHFAFELPPGAQRLLIAEAGEAAPLARFSRFGPHSTLQPHDPADLAMLWSESTLDAGATARVTAAFAAFCAAGDPPEFDAPWYLMAYPEAARALAAGEVPDALAHYARLGHRLGHAPNPFFDETALRLAHPALDAAVAEGRLPCVFALALVEPEALPPLPEFAMPPASPTPDPAATPLPSLGKGLYAATLARAEADPALVVTLQDEAAATQAVLSGQILRHRPLVSVILVTRDRAPILAEAIQSLREQSYPDWELLVCDDGSTDRTADLLREIGDRRIRHLQFARAGAAAARNGGLRLAQGELIAYLDPETLWSPLFLARMVQALQASPAHALACAGHVAARLRGAALHLTARVLPDPAQPETLLLNALLHHRRVTDWLGGFDTDLQRLEDRALLQRQTEVFALLPVGACLLLSRRAIVWERPGEQPLAVAEERLAKVRQRRQGKPPALMINWPGRGRLTLLCGASAEDRAQARQLQVLARPFADLDLLVPEEVVGALAAEPERLGHAFFDRLEAGPLLALGREEAWLARLGPRRDLWRLVSGPEGIALRGPRGMAFPLGPLGAAAEPALGARLAHALYRLLFDPPRLPPGEACHDGG